MRRQHERGFAATAVMRVALSAVGCVALSSIHPASAQTAFAPRNTTQQHNNNKSTKQTTQSLGVPLSYVRGKTGNELLIALPNVKGAALSSRSDGLYLQFRKGKLTGWKGDWGTIRP